MEEELVKRAGVPYKAIPAAGVHGVGLRALPGNLWRLARGFFAARRLLRAFRPQVLFFTGGYVAVPVALASRLPLPGLPRPRILLYVPDIEPGLALKTLARFADRIALTVSESQGYFPPAAGRKLAVTGYPLRPELKAWNREAGLQELGLSAGLPVLLVSGGSSGARSLNHALLAGLNELLGEMQVVHLSGKLDWEAVEAARAALHPDLAARYRAFPYLHSERMGAAFAAADLFVGRAGASNLGELPWFGLPAILVPYPYAWRYQRLNAGYLAERGAAVILADADLGTGLLSTVLRLIHNQPEMERMRASMRALARPEAASSLAGLLHNLSAPAISGGGGDL